jgi:hypothetical protein
VAVLTSAKLNEGYIAQAQYEEDIRRKQLEVERMYRQKMSQEFGLYQRAPLPPPLPLQSLHKRNKRLLLCHP